MERVILAEYDRELKKDQPAAAAPAPHAAAASAP
jgi:hypothetical protein